MKKTVVILQPQTGNRERKEQWNIATGQAAVPNRDIFGTSKRDKEHTVPVNFTLIIYTDSHGSTTTKQKDILYIFNSGEFDPGSGWTLAAGLTHASRTAAGEELAPPAGEWRTGE